MENKIWKPIPAGVSPKSRPPFHKPQNFRQSPVHSPRSFNSPGQSPTVPIYSGQHEIYSRKVFVGGLPIDISERELRDTFGKFGRLFVDWPRRSENFNRDRPGKNISGYVFLVYDSEFSVRKLIWQCYCEEDRFYMLVNSQTMRDKPVQVRPWLLTDTDYKQKKTQFLDSRRTIFIGGLPRPTRAVDLANELARTYGPVAYVGIDIDPELKYPKGAARVTFSTNKAFVAAIMGRSVKIPHGDVHKRVEIKPYMMDDQPCDNCQGSLTDDRCAPYFCGDVNCLMYLCEICWDYVHYSDGFLNMRDHHRPFVRLGDQTKQLTRLPHHG